MAETQNVREIDPTALGGQKKENERKRDRGGRKKKRKQGRTKGQMKSPYLASFN